MTTLLRYQQQRAGRFGRAVPHEADETYDARKAIGNDDEGSEVAGYAIDADAVAEAIVARLLAGGTLSLPPAD